MECSKCGRPSEVVVSRPALDQEGGRFRRRLCRHCNRRWYTLQPALPAEQEVPGTVFNWSGNDVLIDRNELRRWQARRAAG